MRGRLDEGQPARQQRADTRAQVHRRDQQRDVLILMSDCCSVQVVGIASWTLAYCPASARRARIRAQATISAGRHVRMPIGSVASVFMACRFAGLV